MTLGQMALSIVEWELSRDEVGSPPFEESTTILKHSVCRNELLSTEIAQLISIGLSNRPRLHLIDPVPVVVVEGDITLGVHDRPAIASMFIS